MSCFEAIIFTMKIEYIANLLLTYHFPVSKILARTIEKIAVTVCFGQEVRTRLTRKKQFTKSVLIDLEAVEQVRTRRTFKQTVNIELSESDSSDSDSDSTVESSDNDMSIDLRSKKSKGKTATNKPGKKLRAASGKQETEEKFNVKLVQLEELFEKERFFNQQNRMNMERVISQEREENLRKITEGRRENETNMHNLQALVSNFSQQI